MKKKHSNVVVMFILLVVAPYIVFMSLRQPGIFHGIEYEVHVLNGFRRNSSTPMIIWCNSPEEGGDVGVLALQEGEEFSWDLKTTWFWRPAATLRCTVKYESQRRSFKAFWGRRDGGRCFFLKKCFWRVTDGGIYFSNNAVSWQKDFSWP